MTDAAENPALALDGPGAFVPWLASLWRDLRRLVREATATKEERELLHLLDYAASRHGDVLLGAADTDELDDRLDALLGEPEIFQWNALVAPLALSSLRSEAVTPDAFAAAAEPVIGAAQVHLLDAAAPLFRAWLDAQRAVIADIPDEAIAEATSTLEAAGPSVLDAPDTPPEIAMGIGGGLRAGLCTLAIARAIEQERPIPPWLARALVERFLSGMRENLRLVAAHPAAAVPESVLPGSERLDMPAILERHRRARAHAEQTYEAARRRLGGDA